MHGYLLWKGNNVSQNLLFQNINDTLDYFIVSKIALILFMILVDDAIKRNSRKSWRFMRYINNLSYHIFFGFVTAMLF